MYNSISSTEVANILTLFCICNFILTLLFLQLNYLTSSLHILEDLYVYNHLLVFIQFFTFFIILYNFVL